MNIRQLLIAAAMATLVAVPVASDAQYRQGSPRSYPPSQGRRDHTNQNGNIERLVNEAERSSNRFRQLVERQWDTHRERDWNRGWDNDWSRGRNGDNGRGGWNGNSRGNNQGWDRDSRYSRRYGPKESVQRLDEALERLRHAVNRDRRDSRYNDYRVGRDEMMEVVRAADNVDFYFGRGRGQNSHLDREWNGVKRDIEALSRFYNVNAFGRW